MGTITISCQIDGKAQSVALSDEKPTLATLRKKIEADKLAADGFSFIVKGKDVAAADEAKSALEAGADVTLKKAAPPAAPAKSDPKPDAKAEPKAETKAETKPEAKPEPKAETKPKADTDSKPEDPIKAPALPESGSASAGGIKPKDWVAQAPKNTLGKSDLGGAAKPMADEMKAHTGKPDISKLDLSGKTAKAELAEALDSALESHLFPVALASGTNIPLDYTIAPLRIAASVTAESLFAENAAQSMAGTLAGGGTVVRALAFSEKWQSEAYAFGYVRAAAEASQSATMKGVTAGSEGGIQYGKSSGTGTQTDSETLNYCVEYSVPRVGITLDRSQITLSPRFVEDVRAILDGGSANKSEALRRFFTAQGFAVPLKYTLGARLVSSGERSYTGNAKEVLGQMTATLSLATRISAETPKVGVSAKREGGVSTGEEFRKVLTEIQQSLGSEVRALGGADQAGIDQGKWLASLNDPKTWKLIYYDQVVPIWHFLPADLRGKVAEIFQNAKLKDTLSARIAQYRAWQKAYEEVKRDSVTLAKSLDSKRDDSFEWGAKEYPGSKTSFKETYRHTYKELLGILVIPLPNTREATYLIEAANRLPKGHIITWIRVNKDWGTDAYFKVRSGGLMQPSVTLYFESGTGYGHCWSMEVKTVDGDEFRKPVPFPVLDYQFDLVLGQD